MNYQPAHFQIGLVQPTDFITSYRWVNDTQDNVCPVLHCRFNLEDTGQTDVYAKLVDVGTQQGVIMCLNEISGWLLARSSGLPAAKSAFLAYINGSELPVFQASALPPVLTNGTYLFFCSQEISPTQAVGIVETENLLEEQAHWPHAHGAITLDEYTGNADRHLRNMVRIAYRDFALIDHGRLLYRNAEPCWHSDELDDLLDYQFNNSLHYNLYHCRNINSPDAKTNGFTQCSDSAARHAQNMRSVFFEISFWCSKLSPGISAKWLNFLHQRVRRANALLTQRFGLLDLTLHHARSDTA